MIARKRGKSVKFTGEEADFTGEERSEVVKFTGEGRGQCFFERRCFPPTTPNPVPPNSGHGAPNVMKVNASDDDSEP